jgi:hypothetical protein
MKIIRYYLDKWIFPQFQVLFFLHIWTAQYLVKDSKELPSLYRDVCVACSVLHTLPSQTLKFVSQF